MSENENPPENPTESQTENLPENQAENNTQENPTETNENKENTYENPQETENLETHASKPLSTRKRKDSPPKYELPDREGPKEVFKNLYLQVNLFLLYREWI